MADETKRKTGSGRHRPSPVAPAQPSPTATAFAGKAKDLDALRNAVVDAASVGAGLWLSYLFILFYLFIAVGGVTHRNLFLETPTKLPILNVDLPLIGFFVLAPGLFLVVHAYVLLHFVLLAGKVGVFHDELQRQIADDDVRTRLRRQLPSNIFAQFLAGPREVRTGVVGFMLRLIAQISLVAGPLALLVLFQLQFLPYHHEPITWWHRFAVVADLALLWTLWPSIARGGASELKWRNLRRNKIATMALASLVPIMLVFTIATFPGEWLHNNLPSGRFVPWKKQSSWNLKSLHELLIAGEVDLVARKPTSIWSNRLVLPGLDVIDHAKFDNEAKMAALPETVSLRARHLEGAVLIGANLRNADFSAARLQGAKLDSAQLQGATFDSAGLQGASLMGALLHGASLKNAHLQGAALDYAELQGASLTRAELQGASLDSAELQGAVLAVTELQGATLDSAGLQGASLIRAQLQGASLTNAKLQGASLLRAQLQGASLSGAELQGASFSNAIIVATDLSSSLLWRSRGTKARIQDVRLDKANWNPQFADANLYADLQRLIVGTVPDGPRRNSALRRIEALNCATQDTNLASCVASANPTPAAKSFRKSVEDASIAEDAYSARLADTLANTICDMSPGVEALRGMLKNGRIEAAAEKTSVLVDRILGPDCPDAKLLTEDERAKLREMVVK